MGFKEQPEILISKHESEVQKFYNGKSILITGAAGFLGKVILEILLRCCPGIIRIYILLRPKNGLQPEERKENIFKRELFHKLVQENPDVLNKVHVVSGDVSLNNLGMCEKDSHRITEEVSIVFHVAASISFFRPISFLIDQNVVGTYNVIDLCKKLKTLEALVYTSTMYSNSNRKHEIDEIVYKLPFKAEEAARLSKNGNVDALNHLFSKCNPNFLNYYTFSKCVAENLLAEKAKDLPVCIVRPSLIINCLKGALPGYIEDGSALVNMAEGKRLHKSARDEGRMFHTKPRKKEHYTLVKEPFSQYIGYVSVATGEVKAIKKVGKGLIQVVKVYGKNKIDFVPADIAANTHIIAAFLQATKSMTSPSVYNCTSAVKPHTWEDLSVSLSNTLAKHPLPNSYIRPRIIICSSSFLYKFLILIFHFIPATIADAYLWIARKKFRLLKLYKFQERLFGETEPFLKRQWDFRCENFVSLPEKLNETDAKIFNADMKEFDMEKWKSSFYTGCPQYRVNGKLYEDTLTACFLRYFLTYLHKCFLLGSMAVLCYFVFLLYQVLMNVIS